MGQLTEFFMKSPGGPPPNTGFSMPMMKDWVPRRIQPWIYVLTAFCFQFGGGIYLGAQDGIRGATNLMIEDVLYLLYATLAGMAVYFPMLFRMKFRFTNKQLLCGSAIVLAVCNLLTMHCQSMPVLLVLCFIAGMAKLHQRLRMAGPAEGPGRYQRLVPALVRPALVHDAVPGLSEQPVYGCQRSLRRRVAGICKRILLSKLLVVDKRWLFQCQRNGCELRE